MTAIDLNAGALAPVADEVDLVDLPVTGAIPRDLNGVLVRNGPNPLRGRFEGDDVLSWWPEDAMLHAVALQDGRAARYRNRWARTQRWARVYDPDRAPSLVDTNPNVNVLVHAGEILALAEGGAPLAITAGLDSLGASRRHPGLAHGMAAHPKVDPQTGELIAFRADWSRPWLRYGVADAAGVQTVDIDIEGPAPSMVHDIAITATHSIVFDLNAAYDFSMLSRGHRMPLRWHDERRARIGVLPRHGGDVRWFDIAPCFIQHAVNTYDGDRSAIVLDVVRYPWFLRVAGGGRAFDDNPVGVLWRYVIDRDTGIVAEQPLDDAGIELPRINEPGRPPPSLPVRDGAADPCGAARCRALRRRCRVDAALPGAAGQLQKLLRDQLLVRIDHRAARNPQRSREQPRGRQRIAGFDVALADGVPQRLRQLPTQVSGRAVEHADRRNLNDPGDSRHHSGSSEDIQIGSTE
ncbi:retinal pigment epithelial membrane family protein [Burkholderia oklahomensis]|uniref:Retinal pigment epithelial membrane family protein n=1 Tax=Burkholderia oklahomensis TaxID=342113 RepID=A0AAI8FN70_9BURK|nr:retinal pigment epithelial membrane family protein [Burkholderia oklahomensis]